MRYAGYVTERRGMRVWSAVFLCVGRLDFAGYIGSSCNADYRNCYIGNLDYVHVDCRKIEILEGGADCG